MNEKTYISRQISKYATDKKLIEFIDKMREPPIENYAHIQATADKDETGRNHNSLIGIKMLDYTNGTNDKTVSVDANISPDEIMYIFTKLKQGVQNFEFTQEKIFGEPDKDGYSSVSKLKIARAVKGKNGEIRRYPWFVQIENGKGIKEKRGDNGGIHMKSGSYVPGANVYININDVDMYKLLSRISSFISVWELTYAPKNMRTAKGIMFKNMKEKAQ